MTPWVKCPRDSHTWETHSKLAYVTCPHCRLKMKVADNLIDPEEAVMQHFNLDENGVKIRDPNITTRYSPNGWIVDVYFKNGKAWCAWDESSACKHIHYALSLEAVQLILRKRMETLAPMVQRVNIRLQFP